MSDLDPRLSRVCENYQRAVHDKNVAAFISLYHPSARVFDTWGVWAYAGVKERRKVIENWFSSLGDERVGVTFDRVEAVATAGLATLTARVVYVGLSASGVELRSMQNRLTWVLQPEGGAWQIIHEHTSVPIGFSDLKGMLQRD